MMNMHQYSKVLSPKNQNNDDDTFMESGGCSNDMQSYLQDQLQIMENKLYRSNCRYWITIVTIFTLFIALLGSGMLQFHFGPPKPCLCVCQPQDPCTGTNDEATKTSSPTISASDFPVESPVIIPMILPTEIPIPPTTPMPHYNFPPTLAPIYDTNFGTGRPFSPVTNRPTYKIPSPAPTPAPTEEPLPKGPFDPFVSNADLRDAVAAYIQSGSAKNSLVTSVYGYPIGSWDVSRIANFSHVFANTLNGKYNYQFNEPLYGWDVSNATTMAGMFMFCRQFNQPLSHWDTSKVTDMSQMFVYNYDFDQDLSMWDVSKVTNMRSMFSMGSSYSKFNSDISSWDTSNVEDMSDMFSNAERFNIDISNWNVSKVKTMDYMFANVQNFNFDLTTWDTSNVESMDRMFSYAYSFNGDITTWDTTKVITMESMFRHANAFNRDISSWDTQSLANGQEMFQDATSFNQDLSNWNITNMTNFQDMFYGASSFAQNLCSWGEILYNNRKKEEYIRVSRMFTATTCLRSSDPDLNIYPPSPFCYACSS